MIRFNWHARRCACGIIAITAIASCASNPEQSNPRKPASHIIGEMIFELDASHLEAGGRFPFGSGPISSVYEENYRRHVADLPKEDRFAYFWAGLWHFGFQGGTMDLYVDVLWSDPASEEFADDLRALVQNSKESGIDSWRVQMAARVLHHLAPYEDGRMQ